MLFWIETAPFFGVRVSRHRLASRPKRRPATVMRLKAQRVIFGQIRDLRQPVHEGARRPYPA